MRRGETRLQPAHASARNTRAGWISLAGQNPGAAELLAPH
jgi:hypothetical protein